MKRLSPTRRLYIKVNELREQMERLVANDGTPEAAVKLSRVERRYWPMLNELLRRMDELDALVAWHPVSETPPIDTPLIVLHDDMSARIAGYIHRWTGQLAYCNIEEEWGENAYASRTHWRTMPPPPPGVKYAKLTGLYNAEGDK